MKAHSEKAGFKLNIQKLRSCHYFMANRRGKSRSGDRFSWAPKSLWTVTAAIKLHLLVGRKAMTNLDSILKCRDITLLTKVCLAKAMVFPVVTYGSKSRAIRRLSTEELMLLNCGVGEHS